MSVTVQKWNNRNDCSKPNCEKRKKCRAGFQEQVLLAPVEEVAAEFRIVSYVLIGLRNLLMPETCIIYRDV